MAFILISCGEPKSSSQMASDLGVSENIDSVEAIKKMDSIKTIYKEQLIKGDATLPDAIMNSVDGSEQVKIPAGEFIYGINKKDREELLKEMKSEVDEIFQYEFKQTNISLPTFYIDKYEVSNEQFLKFLDATGYTIPKWSKEIALEAPKLPVTNIGYNAARAYAAWAGKRLPSEEEWEKAARGTDGRVWPWGNEPRGENYNGFSQSYFRPVNVGSYPLGASPYGVMDMAGNVYEMTTGDWNGMYAMRGGSFLNAGALTRTMFRWAPGDTINGAVWLGFRCVIDSAQVAKNLKSKE